jgi:hypothetical protein
MVVIWSNKLTNQYDLGKIHPLVHNHLVKHLMVLTHSAKVPHWLEWLGLEPHGALDIN